MGDPVIDCKLTINLDGSIIAFQAVLDTNSERLLAPHRCPGLLCISAIEKQPHVASTLLPRFAEAEPERTLLMRWIANPGCAADYDQRSCKASGNALRHGPSADDACAG